MSNDARCQVTHELDEDDAHYYFYGIIAIIMGVVGSIACIVFSTKIAFFFRGHKIFEELAAGGPGMGCANAVILDRKHVHIPGSGAEGDQGKDLYFVDYLFQGERSADVLSSTPVAPGCSRFFRATVHQFGVDERTYVTLSETRPIPATPMLTFPRAIEV